MEHGESANGGMPCRAKASMCVEGVGGCAPDGKEMPSVNQASPAVQPHSIFQIV